MHNHLLKNKSTLGNQMRVFLHVTYDCNAHCVHCAVPRREDYIDPAVFKKMIDTIPMEFLIIGGGEPLKHPSLEDMISYASQRTKVKIETNGNLLTREFLLRNRQYLFQINVSIDGLEETHDQIRGLDTFLHTVEMIRYARELSIDVAVWSVIMKDNNDEYSKIISLCENMGVDKISFLYATPVGRCHEGMTLPIPAYQKLVEKIQETKGKLQVRIAPYVLQSSSMENPACLINDDDILHVDPLGDIYPCVLLLDNPSFCLGSIEKGYILHHVADPSICQGLVVSLGKDTREQYGIPVCPCKTITKEWVFTDPPVESS
ncbi:MAG: radical SAM/SPASM domain-containing protein [Nanoarchaeota archaeon]